MAYALFMSDVGRTNTVHVGHVMLPWMFVACRTYCAVGWLPQQPHTGLLYRSQRGLGGMSSKGPLVEQLH